MRNLVKMTVLIMMLLLLVSCDNYNGDFAEKAVKSVESSLSKSIDNDEINSFVMKSGSLMEKNDNVATVRVSYDVTLGNGDCKSMTVNAECVVFLEKNDEGEFVENTEKREYTKLTPLNPEEYLTNICESSFVAQIDKSELKGENLLEITEKLFEQWMESFRKWEEDRSFVIKEYSQKPLVDGHLQTSEADENWGKHEGATGPRRKYPEAKRGWLFFPGPAYTFNGYAEIIEADNGNYGGLAFGNAGSTVPAGLSFFGISNRMVLSEWEDCYTLEMDKNFMRRMCEMIPENDIQIKDLAEKEYLLMGGELADLE